MQIISSFYQIASRTQNGMRNTIHGAQSFLNKLTVAQFVKKFQSHSISSFQRKCLESDLLLSGNPTKIFYALRIPCVLHDPPISSPLIWSF
jgi:hypothetical protein